MASIIRIKRSSVSGNPATLGAGELAYSALTDNGSNGGDRLYIGIGTETSGNAANHFVIGGKFFTDRLDHTAGTLTASSALVVDSNKKIDDFYVDNLQLNGNTLSTTDTNGNLLITPNGTGKTVITNPYIGDDSTSLAEFIYDTVGGAVTGGTGITVTNNDGANTSTISITNTGVSGAGTPVGSSTSIPVITFNAQGQLTTVTTASISTSLSIAGDTGTDTVSLGSDTLTIAGGEGIDVAVTDNTITIAGEDASSSNKGIASFSSSDFSVSSGAVSISNVTLGTQTTGNYVATIAGTTNQVSVSGSGSETAAVTLSLPQDIHSGASPSFAGLSLSGNIAMGTNTITGLADPVNPQDAATKAYVDAARSGLDVKSSVRVATTENITLSGTQTIDGVALSVGNRVLVKDQGTGSANGIYVVASGSWARSEDADNNPGSEVTSGMFTFVEEGTLNSDSGWVLTTNDPITLGTTSLSFAQFSGTGQIVAGNGLTKTGNTLDVQVGTGIAIVSDTVTLASSVAGAGLTFTSGVLDVVGTTDRITINSDSIDIASTYAGQSSITTLGTIATGTWNGTTIGSAYGGTGFSTYATGDLIYASATNTLAKRAAGTDGQVLQMNSSGVPVWGDIDGGTY
jgi:hypothetical protein